MTAASKHYVIYDERALSGDTDRASVLESCTSLHEVITKTTWDGVRDPLGVVAEYDISSGDELVNERILGTVPVLQSKARRMSRTSGKKAR